jgi:hypothetical protein
MVYSNIAYVKIPINIGVNSLWEIVKNSDWLVCKHLCTLQDLLNFLFFHYKFILLQTNIGSLQKASNIKRLYLLSLFMNGRHK